MKMSCLSSENNTYQVDDRSACAAPSSEWRLFLLSGMDFATYNHINAKSCQMSPIAEIPKESLLKIIFPSNLRIITSNIMVYTKSTIKWKFDNIFFKFIFNLLSNFTWALFKIVMLNCFHFDFFLRIIILINSILRASRRLGAVVNKCQMT